MLGEDLTTLPEDSRRVAVRWLNQMLRVPGVANEIRALALQTLLELTIWEAEQKRLRKLLGDSGPSVS